MSRRLESAILGDMTSTLDDYRPYDYNSLSREALAVLRDRVSRVAKAARRLGLPEPTLEIVAERLVSVTGEGGEPTTEWRIDAVVRGESPRLDGGWTVVGAIDHLPGGNVVRVTDEIDAEIYRESASTCDHCQTSRRRSMTVLVRAGDGEIRRIGRNCVKDFLGHDLPAYWDLYNVITEEEIEEMRMSGRVIPTVLDTMTAAAWAISHYGYQTKDSENPTRYVMGSFGNRRVMESRPLTPEACRLAADALAYWREIDPKSDFEKNVVAIVRSGFVDHKHDGLIAGAVRGYQRHLETETERAARAARRAEIEAAAEAAEPVPTGRIDVVGTVIAISVKTYDTGIRTVMTVVDDRGFRVWGTRPDSVSSVVAGNRIRFSAEVSPSREDTKFGFFKRPTKAEILGAAS